MRSNRQIGVSLHKRQKEIYDNRSRRRVVAAGRRFGKCVKKDTLVLMADGLQKPIQDVCSGDMVWSYDKDKSSYVKKKVRRVVNNGKRAVFLIKSKTAELSCTPSHPLLINNEWVKTSDITHGSSLTIFDGSYEHSEVIDSISLDGEHETYDIEIEGSHSFIANGVVTHNTALARAEILRAASNAGWNVWYVAPTYRMAKQIMWRDLMKEIPRGWIKSANATVMDIVLKNGSVISLRGADKPDSLRGVEVNFLVMDEMQDIKPIAWEEALRPTLAKSRGRVIFLGCVAPETKVMTSEGIVEIGSFDKGSADKTLTECKVELAGINKTWNMSDGFYNNGTVPVKKVKTEFGFSLTGAFIHPVLIMDTDGIQKWCRMEDLKRGFRVAIDRQSMSGYPLSSAIMSDFLQDERRAGKPLTSFADLNMYLVGLWSSCGEAINGNRVSFTVPDKKLKKHLLSARVRPFGKRFVQAADRENKIYVNSALFARVMREAGCIDTSLLPGIVNKTNLRSLRYFLSGAIDGSGTVHNLYNCVEYSAPPAKAADMQIVALRCGLIAKRTEEGLLFLGDEAFKLKKVAKFYSSKVNVKLGFDNSFKDGVPFQSERLKSAFNYNLEYRKDISYKKLASIVSSRKPRSKQAVSEIEKIIMNGYFWDTVSDITEGVSQTYDFTIPETNSFWSNGFISHNTPKSHNYFYKLYKFGLNPDYIRAGAYKSWQIPTIESPFIPEAEIEEARADMDPRSFRQEFMAAFETVSGSVYYNFSRELHVRDCPFNPHLPLWVGQDFNVSPMSSVILQRQPNGELWAIDEIFQLNSNTMAICNELERRYWKYTKNTIIYPDPAGGSRSTARGESDLDIFRERGFRRIKYRKKHPPVADRINAVNKVLMNADGKIILRVSPSCKNLIESLEQTVYKKDTNEIDKRLNIEHITDALGYPIEIEFPRKKIELIGISI